MSREEDLIRSTTQAIASSVREVPPLRLEPAPGEPRPARRRRDRGPRPRRWWSWGAPLAAAAVVVALAVALVAVRNMPNDGATSPSSGASTSGLAGAPRYYVALSSQYGIVAGDSVTGKALATFAPPANTIFVSVSAAADDRTFAVFALTSSTGSFGPGRMKNGVPVPGTGAVLTASWYAVRLSPGTARPASLTPLPIKPWSWPNSSSYPDPAPGQVIASALSGSGQELAVADFPTIPAAKKLTPNWHEVKVYSVATGQLLRDWIENNPKTRMETVLESMTAGIPPAENALTWIDGDQAVAFATSYDHNNVVTGTVRRLGMTGAATGNMLKDATVIWSGNLPWGTQDDCYAVGDWPPLMSADGKTISCTVEDSVPTNLSRISFHTDPLPAPAVFKARVDYQVTVSKMFVGPLAVLWMSPSNDTRIGVWDTSGGPTHARATLYIGVISHGKFTPLKLPTSLHSTGILQPGSIAW